MSSSHDQPLTMSVAEYVLASGIPEHSVRQELAAGRIPHRRVGKRGLIRILRLPALAALSGESSTRESQRAELRERCFIKEAEAAESVTQTWSTLTS
jgi:hypothetical protein